MENKELEQQKRLTVKEAAYILNCSDDAVRNGMLQDHLPIGFITSKGENRRTEFFIYENKLRKFLGY